MLYTLSLFALEPMRWIQTLEWRTVSEMESCAIGVFWKSLGDAMDISWDDLPSSSKGWVDGLEWLDELREWSLMYERNNMIASFTNHMVAETTLGYRLQRVPSMLRKPVQNLLVSVLEDRLRLAIVYAVNLPPRCCSESCWLKILMQI